MSSTEQGFLPNFIIAGAPKAGTSSLHTWLSDHPDALGSKPKETYYFVDPGTHMYDPDRHINNGLDGYRKFFQAAQDANPRVVFEATPAYLYYRLALELLPDLETRPKFLFVLREPASQIFSLFVYFKNNWSWIPHDLSFSDFITEVRTGKIDFKGNELARNALQYAAYVDYLDLWHRRVGPERMLVRLFDDLVADQRGFIKEVARWLGLDPEFYDTYTFPRSNETYQVKSQRLQSVNVALRGLIPGGVLYRNLRSFYRTLNTRKASGPDSAEVTAIAALREEFRCPNRRLAQAFGLDLGVWREQDEKRN